MLLRQNLRRRNYRAIGLLNCFHLLFTIVHLTNLYQSHCLTRYDAPEADTAPVTLTVTVVQADNATAAEKVEEKRAADHENGQPGVWNSSLGKGGWTLYLNSVSWSPGGNKKNVHENSGGWNMLKLALTHSGKNLLVFQSQVGVLHMGCRGTYNVQILFSKLEFGTHAANGLLQRAALWSCSWRFPKFTPSYHSGYIGNVSCFGFSIFRNFQLLN